MKNTTKKFLFYGFLLLNLILITYLYFGENKINPEVLKKLLSGQNFLISYLVYILILIIRGLTLLPGTAFLLAGIYLFSFVQVLFAIQIAILCYCVIIYHFAHRLNFKVPKKILQLEAKVKTKEVPIIFALCFIPGISINVLIYFLTIIDIKLRNILIGIIAGTLITSSIYILIWQGAFNSVSYFF